MDFLSPSHSRSNHSYERVQSLCSLGGLLRDYFSIFFCGIIGSLGGYVSDFAGIVQQGVNYRACHGAYDAICRGIQGAYQGRGQLALYFVGIQLGVGHVLVSIDGRLRKCLTRAYLYVSRNDHAIAVREAGISVSIGRQVSYKPFLDRVSRHAVSKTIAIQVVFARNVASGAHAFSI